MQNLNVWSFENEFNLHENKPQLLGGAHFHMNGLAQRLVLTRIKAKSNLEMAYYFFFLRDYYTPMKEEKNQSSAFKVKIMIRI